MGYLDQLKNISNVPDAGPKEPKKPQETGCLGFLGSPPKLFEKIDAAEPANDSDRKAWRWLLHLADHNPLEVAFSPAATRAEVLASYPDALTAEPIEDDTRPPTPIRQEAKHAD